MNQLIIALIILGLAAWFVFSLRKVIQGAAGCARCCISSLRRHKKGASAYATVNGHPVILDRREAQKRRESLRQAMMTRRKN